MVVNVVLLADVRMVVPPSEGRTEAGQPPGVGGVKEEQRVEVPSPRVVRPLILVARVAAFDEDGVGTERAPRTAVSHAST